MAKKTAEKPKLYGVYRNGKRVYLPPKGQAGIDRRRAEIVSAGLPGSEVVCIFDPEEENGQAS